MNKFAIKYIDAESDERIDFIKVVHTDRPYELLQVLRESDSIEVDDNYYRFESSKYQIPETVDHLDVIIVYLDPIY